MTWPASSYESTKSHAQKLLRSVSIFWHLNKSRIFILMHCQEFSDVLIACVEEENPLAFLFFPGSTEGLITYAPTLYWGERRGTAALLWGNEFRLSSYVVIQMNFIQTKVKTLIFYNYMANTEYINQSFLLYLMLIITEDFNVNIISHSNCMVV